MTVRGTTALVAIALVLGTWVALFERHPAPGPAARPNAPLLAAPPSRVAHVEVQDGSRVVVARREAGGWTTPEGRPWPAGTVDGFLDELARLEPLRRIDPPPGAAGDYGLGRIRMRCLSADGTTLLDAVIGDDNPASTSVYYRVTGEQTIELVGRLLAWELEKLLRAAPLS